MDLRLLVTITILSFSTISFAQMKVVKEANLMYRSENYCEAADKCKAAYTKLTRKGNRAKTMKGDMAFKTAESYRQIENASDAHEWYERAILLDYQNTNPEVFYYNGQMLQMMGEFDKSIVQFQEYKKLVPDDKRSDVAIQSSNMNKEYKADKTRHIIQNETKLNTKVFEMSAQFGDRKESKMYYSTNRDGSTGGDKDPRTCQSYMDIWFTEADKKGNWGEPKLAEGDSINTEDNEGTPAFDGRNKTMFFTRCPNVKKQNLGCDIWMSEAKGKDAWKKPVKLNLKNNDSISVGHPCVSEDGKFLIFTSDMPGGYGGRDLWYSEYDRRSDSWTAPKNMGPEINTGGNEMFANFGKNGELIYASDGLPGMGGLDIYKASKVGETMAWENPVNMGSPINSDHNDYSLIEVTDRKGYFTSERKGGNSENTPDLYSYELPPFLYSLKIIALELPEKDSRIADAKVNVSGSDGTAWEGYTNQQGEVYFDKRPTGDRYVNENTSYTILLSKEGYYADKKGAAITTVNLNYAQDFVIEMGLFPIKPPKPIQVPEIRYPLGKATLLVDSTINSKDSLLFVYNLLIEYPGMMLELRSHTDSRGSDAANQKLSEARAKTCVDYLVKEKGIDPRRLVPVGRGEREPATWVDENGKEISLTEAYINQFQKSDKAKFERLHQLNRRTDVKIISMDYAPEKIETAVPE